MAKDFNSSQAGTYQQDGVNDPSVRVIRGKNLFPQSHHHASTCRYGEVDPVMCFKAERGDVIDYRLVSDLNTYTLASPLKSKVNMYSAAFKVPMRCLYPRNWDIMLPIPVKGDDVPVTSVNSVEIDSNRCIYNLSALVGTLTSRINRYFSLYVNNETTYDCRRFVPRAVFALETLLSAGGLLPKFNIHFNNFKVSVGTAPDLVDMSFDKWFDTLFCPFLIEFLKQQAVGAIHIASISDSDTRQYHVCVTDDDMPLIGSSDSYISFRRFLELMRTGEFEFVDTLVYDYFTENYPVFSFASTPFIVNLEPVFAYQMICAHFFSNSKVDFVYTAQLWRDNLQSMITQSYSTALSSFNFEYNGTRRLYDVCSYYSMKRLFEFLSVMYLGWSSTDSTGLGISAIFNIFGIQRSLRYGDYFTGAHTEPLAVGDINAPVTDGSVSALDITRKLQMSRLLNKVNIAGQRISDYLTALFGGAVPAAPDDVPVRLSLEKRNVGGFEVNNTGADQLDASSENITTTNLRLSDSKYMFEVAIDEPCWLIAVQYFDAVRIYSRTIDRFAYHYNRYDDFIPDMQFVGDQPIYSTELSGLSSSKELAYAYQLRYMEYKNRYGYASGGFVEWLKSWALITDNSDGNPFPVNIDGDYIRSSPSEFDRFYKSLTGYSLGSYFHFITFNTNVLNAYRQMVYAPEILA